MDDIALCTFLHSLKSIYVASKVILAGKKETVSSAIQKAERFRTELLRRGVLLVPVIWGEGREPQIEKKGFGAPTTAAAAALPSIGVSKINLFLFCPFVQGYVLSFAVVLFMFQ